MKCKEVEQHN